MSTVFDRPLYGFRFVPINFGDTLQAIALRELGDASRWPELISYNKLVPPFLVNTAAEGGPGVKVAGEMLLVPAPTPAVSSTLDPDQVFGVDMLLAKDGGLAVDENGDFAVVGGVSNYSQALRNAINTERGELLFHQKYGSLIRRLLGRVNGPTVGLLAAQYARATAAADARTRRVTSASAEVNGDVVNVIVEAEAINGRSVSVASK